MTTGRAVAYVRVSDESQVEGHSLAAQRREIQRYCDRADYRLTRVYADEGVSAHSDQIARRPALAALLADASVGHFDLVIVHTIDRWARNVSVQREALQALGRAGVGFVSVTENFDFSTPAGRLMLTMIGGVSEFFSDQLGVHVVKGLRERAESGLPAGPVPFGYRRIDAASPAEVIPEEAEAVQGAFARRISGASNGEVAAWLNNGGFEPRGAVHAVGRAGHAPDAVLRWRRHVPGAGIPRSARADRERGDVRRSPGTSPDCTTEAGHDRRDRGASGAGLLRRMWEPPPERAESLRSATVPGAARQELHDERAVGGCGCDRPTARGRVGVARTPCRVA